MRDIGLLWGHMQGLEEGEEGRQLQPLNFPEARWASSHTSAASCQPDLPPRRRGC